MENKETINQLAYYNESAANFKDSLVELQTKLDELAKATDLLTSNLSIPIKFTSRVKVGELTSSFSSLVKSFLQYQGDLKKALESQLAPEAPAPEAPAPEAEATPAVAPEGSPSES